MKLLFAVNMTDKTVYVTDMALHSTVKQILQFLLMKYRINYNLVLPNGSGFFLVMLTSYLNPFDAGK